MDREVIQLSNLVKMSSPDDVLQEVKYIITLMSSECDTGLLDAVFGDVVGLFRGEYPGYRACNTAYHDLKHTTDAFLAMARLMHGAFVQGVRFGRRNIDIGLISALLHDTGYIQTEDDRTGTGAKYTLVHVARSIDFVHKYLGGKGLSREDIQLCASCLRCTGLEVKIIEVPFRSKEHELLGHMLGTADLIGQMADRTYLEKLVFLYHEFEEGKVPGFGSELELLEKTPDFYEFTRSRLSNELGNVNRYMRPHMRDRWNIDRDLYAEAIERHINYIRYVVEFHRDDYRVRLRRGGKIQMLLEIEMWTRTRREGLGSQE